MFKVKYGISGLSGHVPSYTSQGFKFTALRIAQYVVFYDGQIVIAFKVKYGTSGTSGDIIAYKSPWSFYIYNI